MSRQHPEKKYGQGESWIILASIRDADDKPIDLTGATIMFIVAGKAGKVIDLVSPCPEITVTDVTGGQCTIKIEPDLAPTRYDWELWAILGSGEKSRQAHGQILVEPTIKKKYEAAP